jgi:hypothetical protein
VEDSTFDKALLYGCIKAIVICSTLGFLTWSLADNFGLGVICGIIAIGMICGGRE